MALQGPAHAIMLVSIMMPDACLLHVPSWYMWLGLPCAADRPMLMMICTAFRDRGVCKQSKARHNACLQEKLVAWLEETNAAMPWLESVKYTT